MRSASSISAGGPVGPMDAHAPARAGADRPDRFAMGGEAREIGVAQALRPRREQRSEPAGWRNSYCRRTDRSPRSDRRSSPVRRSRPPRSRRGSRAQPLRARRENRRSAEPSSAARRAAAGGNGACEGPWRRSSVAIASAKRSMTPCVANGRVRPRRPARSPPRTQRSAKASASNGRPVDLRRRRETRCELHRGRAIEPDPDRMRRLPLALAHESALFTRRATPVDSRRRLAGEKGPKLPEGLARAGAPPAMNAVPHRLRHAAGGDDQARQTGRKRRGVATDGGRQRHCAERRRIIGSSWPQAARSPPKSSRPRRERRRSAPCGA